MKALVRELRKKKRAATDRPRPGPQRTRASAAATPSSHVANEANGASRKRDISAAVRRQVWTRDGARCRYVNSNGRRCAETAWFEIHHRVPYAKGGPPDAENLELRCRAHNDLAAEQDFGREHMARMRGEPPAKDQRWRGSTQGAGRFAPDAVRLPSARQRRSLVP